jgi:chemotaxis protein CheX
MQFKNEIDVFIEGVRNYFNLIDSQNEPATIGAPYLIRNETKLGLDYTGMIRVSGDARGAVFFSSSQLMLKYILLRQSEQIFDEIYLRDIAGEVANTIAGNARRYLGSGFHISPPRVLKTDIDRKYLSSDTRSYIIPVRWRNNNAQLVISIAMN